jgi:hypothetical protein
LVMAKGSKRAVGKVRYAASERTSEAGPLMLLRSGGHLRSKFIELAEVFASPEAIQKDPFA